MSRAIADIRAALAVSWRWRALAWRDIKQRYRGSVLGPLWIIISISIMAAGLSLVLASPFGVERARYAPYVVTGLVLWQFLASLAQEGCQMFVSQGAIIRQTPAPLSLHAFRFLTRNLIVLAHTAVIVPIVMIAFRVTPGWQALMALPALLLLILAGFGGAVCAGLLTARFRDVPPMVGSAMQLLFFVTPIFWPPRVLDEGYGWVVAANPLFALIDIVRAPLLGVAPQPASWPVALLATAAALAFAFAAFSWRRSRLAYWV